VLVSPIRSNELFLFRSQSLLESMDAVRKLAVGSRWRFATTRSCNHNFRIDTADPRRILLPFERILFPSESWL
jgi:hypothetical protein